MTSRSASGGLRYTPSFAFKNNAPSSASAADDITAFMMVAFVIMAPLLVGC